MVTYEQIINGIISYIRTYVVNSISDKTSRRLMAGLADLLAIKPNVLTNLLNQYPVLDMFKDGELYDLNSAETVIKKNVQEYGAISIEALGGTFLLDQGDIVHLMQCIRG